MNWAGRYSIGSAATPICPLGDIYSRDGLDIRSREMVAISSLATLGHANPQLRIHIRAATQVGVTKAEIIEILMQTAVYAGFPAALNALASCHDLLTEECPQQLAKRESGLIGLTSIPASCSGGRKL